MAQVPAAHPAVDDITGMLRNAVQRARYCLRVAQQRQQQLADKKRRELEFAVGDKVWLNIRNIRLRMTGARKFGPVSAGPFRITERIGKVAYRLELPASMSRLHPVFHVSLLTEAHDDGSRDPVAPPMLDGSDEPLAYVESIINMRTRARKSKSTNPAVRAAAKERRPRRPEFLVTWSGYGPEHNQWLPASAFSDPAFPARYERRHRAAIEAGLPPPIMKVQLADELTDPDSDTEPTVA